MKLLSCSVLSFLTVLAVAATDSCNCGFTSTVNDQSVLFTEAFETDFRHVADLKPSEWRPQMYNKTAAASHGPYGRLYSNATTLPNTVGSDAGLQLVVSSAIVDTLVPCAEVAAKRRDFFYGTYRVGMKLSNESGTCAAFYWYFNDTQEIDIEFLSKDFNPSNNSYPVNIVLHSPLSLATGFDAVKAGTWTVAYLPFNPAEGFHEYRFDFVQAAVYFYADGTYLAEMKGLAVPTTGGKLLLAHWSNGKAAWSGGPPKQDSVMTVQYVKAYFNSSEPGVVEAAQDRCDAHGMTCAIPGMTEAKDLDSGAAFFNLTSANGGSGSAGGSGSGESTSTSRSGGGENSRSTRGLGSLLTASLMAGFLLSL
ncbi:glycoside hydrolase, family 16 [Chaetomium strumarium]|uniref:Glycoside hydrolase, family 16 n=1 Tax=Chaetomium strumarium TaxID=1170767 RepID=A0AAJ0M118_9PEZI|nr:glycoside hydrolase, family 16 [Chaetomium strumarium]